MGQPRAGNAARWPGEYIARFKLTRRTETSKYPEEKKSIEIPLVAASERGTAEQTVNSGTVWKV